MTTQPARGVVLPAWKVQHALSLKLGETMQVRVPIEFRTSTVNGYTSRKQWEQLDWQYDKIFADPGGTALFGPGWYLHVPTRDDCDWRGCQYRVRSRTEPGDVVYVKESVYIDDYLYSDGGRLPKVQGDILPETIYYHADGTCCEQIPECMCATEGKPKWRGAGAMPMWCARLFFRVADVRPERVQDISEEDAIAEGVPEHSIDTMSAIHEHYRDDFCEHWDALNGKKHPWRDNPWVWAYTLERIERP